MNPEDLIKMLQDNPFVKEYVGQFNPTMDDDLKKLMRKPKVDEYESYDQPIINEKKIRSKTYDRIMYQDEYGYIEVRKPQVVSTLMSISPVGAKAGLIAVEDLENEAIRLVRQFVTRASVGTKSEDGRWYVIKMNANGWHAAIYGEKFDEAIVIVMFPTPSVPQNSALTMDDLFKAADNLFFNTPSEQIKRSEHTIRFDASEGA